MLFVGNSPETAAANSTLEPNKQLSDDVLIMAPYDYRRLGSCTQIMFVCIALYLYICFIYVEILAPMS